MHRRIRVHATSRPRTKRVTRGVPPAQARSASGREHSRRGVAHDDASDERTGDRIDAYDPQ